jgi:hypothetical protein
MQMAAAQKQAEGAEIQGAANAQSYMYQAMVAKNNAAIARRNAYFTSAEGNYQAATLGLKAKAEAGQMETSYAGHGIDPESWSAMSSIEAANALGGLAEKDAMEQSRRQAWGFNTEATGMDKTAAMDTQAASWSLKAAATQSQATILGAAGQFVGGMSGIVNAMPGGGNFGFNASADTSGGGTSVINPAATSSGGGETTGGTGYVDYNPGKSDYSTIGGIP